MADFDWTSDSAVVFRSHPGVAVYFNRSGDVVIRAQADLHEEEDPIIVLPVELVKPLIDRLTAAVQSAAQQSQSGDG